MKIHMLGLILLRLAIVAAIVGMVMGLWNVIIPTVTGWTAINYWQALGLTVLFHLLMVKPLRPHRAPYENDPCLIRKISGSKRAEMRNTILRLRKKVSKKSPEERKAFVKRIMDVDVKE